MITDPHIALIRTEPDVSFYDRVTRRIAARNDPPRGILLHFSAVSDERLLVGTAFRDPASMVDTFVGYTALEAQNELLESGVSFDLTRDEHPLERLFIEDDVPSQPFGLIAAGEIAAFSSEFVKIDVAEYRALTQKIGSFDGPLEGRIAHVAFSQNEQIHAIDFWATRAAGQAWYDRHAELAAEHIEEAKLPEIVTAGWIDLHSFFISAPQNDPIRKFYRTASGPVDAPDD